VEKVIVNSFEEFESYTGKEIGASDYVKITQEQINKFAEATGDFQWIHTNPEKCAKESQFGTTIAHGYLTLSLIPQLFDQIVDFTTADMTVNYGIESFKFNQAVKVDSEVRLIMKLKECKDLRGTCKAKVEVKMEIKGEKKPAFTGIIIFLYHFAN